MTGQWKMIRFNSEGPQVVEPDPQLYRYIVFHPYMGPTEISRYRDCIVCDKSFKKPHEGEYRCESCRSRVLEAERRDRAGKQLLDANARIKP